MALSRLTPAAEAAHEAGRRSARAGTPVLRRWPERHDDPVDGLAGHCACGGGCAACAGGGLPIGAPDDPFEREADRLADDMLVGSTPGSVTPTAGSLVQRTCACGRSNGDEGDCAECAADRLQRSADGPMAGGFAPPAVHEVLASPGAALDGSVRSALEPRLGDLAGVRIHTDARAAASARAVDAAAYTAGLHVVFGDGHYAPDNDEGRRLLVHELTHVVQQANGEVSEFAGRVVPPEHSSEAEARSHSTVRPHMPAAGPGGSSLQRPAIQRQPRTVTHPVPAVSPAPTLPTKDGAEMAYAALVNEWERVSAVQAALAGGDKLKGECAAFILMIGEKPALYAGTVMRSVADPLGAHDRAAIAQFKSDYKTAIDRFANQIGARVLADLQAGPSDPLDTWQWAQLHFAEFLSDGGRGTAFNDRVENKLLGEFEKKAAKEVGKRPAELQAMADTQVARIIDRFADNTLIGITQAGAEFHLPMPLGGARFNKAEAASATTRFAFEIGEIFLKDKGKLVKLGLHALPFATLAIEIYSIWDEANKEEEQIKRENKRAELEERAKHALFLAQDQTVKAIQDRSDVLSVLVVAEALKRKIDPKAAGKHRLQELVIDELGFDPDVGDVSKVLEKASSGLRDGVELLQKELAE